MILVTGGEGLVGSNIPGDDLVLTDILDESEIHMDITDAEETEHVITKYKPKSVVHCAAWIDPDQCEKDPIGCYNVNVLGTMNVLNACQKVGAKLVYISTQLVFDGEKRTPYLEDDPAGGLQQYGLSHYVAEQYVKSYDNHLILRTSLCHGSTNNGRRYGFIYWVADSLKENKQISVVDTLWTTPTDIKDFGFCVRALVDYDATGLYHHAGQEFLSRYDFARRTAEEMGLDTSLIQKIEMGDLMTKWVARRPIYAGLDSTKVKKEYGIEPSDPFAWLRT